jgi:hypothetical protein
VLARTIEDKILKFKVLLRFNYLYQDVDPKYQEPQIPEEQLGNTSI